MTELPTDKLESLIESKQRCLTQLRDLGVSQATLIEQGEMTQLLRLLSSKQHLIVTLQEIERGLAPFRDDDPDLRSWRSIEDRSRCASRAQECQELLDQIVRLEQTNEASMTDRRRLLADRLQQVQSAARASGAYRSQSRGKVLPRSQSARKNAAFGDENGHGDRSAAPNTLDLSSEIR